MSDIVNFDIHFGLLDNKHEIYSESLIVFLESYQKITEYFGVNADIQIGIPKEGGWKTNISMVIAYIGFSPIVSLMTGKSAVEWAKIGHKNIVSHINEFIVTEDSNIPKNEKLDECIKQKNKIYEQLKKDKCINTFDLGQYPPIPRNNFQLYIREFLDEESIYLGETNITVHSPDWKGKRSWKGHVEILQDNVSFDFYKDLTGKFWKKIELDKLTLHTEDKMTVQLIERPGKKVKYQVIRVLTYNSDNIDDRLSDTDIQKIAILDNKQKTSEKIQDN